MNRSTQYYISVTGIVLAASGILMHYMYSLVYADYVGYVLIIFSVAHFVFTYLTGRSTRSAGYVSPYEDYEYRRYKSKIKRIEGLLERLPLLETIVVEKEKAQVVAALNASLEGLQDSIDDFDLPRLPDPPFTQAGSVEPIRIALKKYTEFLQEKIGLQAVSSTTPTQTEQDESQLTQVRTIVGRLARELDALGRKSNIYLGVGSAISFFAAIALFFLMDEIATYLIKAHPQNAEDVKTLTLQYLYPMVGRFGFIIFAEAIAVYFLRLHSDAVERIRYYHGEITNIELKLHSVRISVSFDAAKNLSALLRELASDDRNRSLKKGETTGLLELLKAKDNRTLDALLRRFSAGWLKTGKRPSA